MTLGRTHSWEDARGWLVLCIALLLSACHTARHPLLEDLSGREDVSFYKLHSLTGTRDGDRLAAQAVLSDSSSILTLDLQFAVGSPTTLSSGSWRWARNNQVRNGDVRPRSVTFLGGQDGPPSIGGSFDLMEQGAAKYRVTLPVTELKRH